MTSFVVVALVIGLMFLASKSNIKAYYLVNVPLIGFLIYDTQEMFIILGLSVLLLIQVYLALFKK